MTMCYHPWVGLDISPQGEFKPCCKYRDVLGTTFDEYENNPSLVQLRDDFLNNRKPDGCARCWRDEDARLPSKRTLDNEYVFENKPVALDKLKVVSVALGNTCNLACRICSSYPSSRWGAEAEKLVQFFPDTKVWKHNKFYKDEEFLRQFKERTTDVIRIEIPGGEPFYADSEPHYELLIHLLEHNPEQITLHYTTNVTKFPSREMINIWRRFKKVDIQMSIDGIRDQFSYNRWPAKWSNVLLNIGRYQQLQREEENIQTSISHSVSVFTVYQLPEFLDWCEAQKLPEPYLGLVSNPLHYSVTVFPKDSKVKLVKHLLKNPKCGGIARAIMAKDDSNQLDNLAKYLKILDKQREQSFAETFPETFQLLGDECQTLYQLY